MFGRAIWDKLPEYIFAFSSFYSTNFKIFKNHEGDLSSTVKDLFPEPNMWLLVNHTKPTNTVQLISFNSGQLQISERAITKQQAITK